MPRFVTDSKLYGWDAPESRLRSARRTCAAFAAASLVLTVIPGLIPCGVARHSWVGFAGTASLIAVMLEIIAVVRFSVAKPGLDYRTFHSIHWMMDYAPLLHAMLMAVALVAGIVSCFQQFTGAPDLLALLLFALSAVSSLVLRRIYRAIPTYSVKEHEP